MTKSPSNPSKKNSDPIPHDNSNPRNPDNNPEVEPQPHHPDKITPEVEPGE